MKYIIKGDNDCPVIEITIEHLSGKQIQEK